jgi:integrase
LRQQPWLTQDRETFLPVEMAREGVPLIVIQRQLGHSNLGITSVYLQGIDNAEIIETVHARRAPMIPVSASLRL